MGSSATFSGNLKWKDEPDGWTVDLGGSRFDDIELALLADPPLTTVHVPHREMGRRAARMLIEMLEGQSVLQSVKLETDIRVRQSLGAAPGIG